MEKREIFTGMVVRHFNGGIYTILIPNAYWHEDKTRLVVYENLETHQVCVRPYDMFMSEVDRKKYPDAKQKYRFEIL